MSTVINYKNIKEDIIYLLRNNDVISLSDRGCTTTTDTGSWSGDTSHLIAVTNVKNIRSITVGGAPLVYGTDYTYDINFLDTTIKCKITLNSAQTGAYVITYDFGTDKIFPDFPKPERTINSYPVIGVDIIGDDSTEESADGAIKESSISITIQAYDQNSDEVEEYLRVIKGLIIDNHKSLFYIKYIRRLAAGPMGQFGKYKVQTRAQDYLTEYNLETE